MFAFIPPSASFVEKMSQGVFEDLVWSPAGRKSETRRPKAERNPKPEIRTNPSLTADDADLLPIRGTREILGKNPLSHPHKKFALGRKLSRIVAQREGWQQSKGSRFQQSDLIFELRISAFGFRISWLGLRCYSDQEGRAWSRFVGDEVELFDRHIREGVFPGGFEQAEGVATFLGCRVVARPGNDEVHILLVGLRPPFPDVFASGDRYFDLAAVGVMEDITAQFIAKPGAGSEDGRLQEVEPPTSLADWNVVNVVGVSKAVGGARSNLDQAAHIEVDPADFLNALRQLR